MKRTVVVLTLAASAAHASDPRIVTEVEMQQRAARPVAIVAPQYPPAALQAKVEGTVDIFGTIKPDGHMRVERLEGSPEREDFKAAVTEVIGLWKLEPAYHADCRPHETPGQVRVWFELKEGQPAISVSRGVLPESPRPPPESAALKVVKRVDPVYPRAGVYAGVQGTVEAFMEVGASGEVTNVEIVPNALPYQFDNAVVKALKQFRFEPLADAKPACAAYTINFRLRD
jgi:TonB family protein